MRILVVEDDPLTARALDLGLAAESYAVEIAADGVEGLHRAREFDYDAMILDLMLPELSGLDVCSQLRASGRDLPVLMLSALGDPVNHTTGLDTGADDYLPKPFTFPVLLAHLRALLRRGPARLPPVLREFAVLRYLMTHPECTITKQELLDHVWGENGAADHNVVQVYISSLRRKIDTAGEDSLIATVRGVGYRLRDGSS